jgi:nitroimidazol reductase NimA-like FMN-containing flavoprotein (pyridoxamine 5'-phosphate oxidase superfamily)
LSYGIDIVTGVSESLVETERTRHRRLREQGSLDREALIGILRAGFVCHLGVIIDGHPMVIPTVYGLSPDARTVYVHGSVASRSLGARPDTEICVTVTHVDGLVMARSVFEHGVNYRSAMLYGTPRLLAATGDKLLGLEHLSEHIAKGQWAYARQPNKKELAKTSLLALELEEASVKIRSGGPSDGDSPDAELPVWAGVIPLHTSWGAPEPADDLKPDIDVPPHLASFGR